VTVEMNAALSSLMTGLHLPVRLGALTLFGPHRDRFVLVHQVVPSVELLHLQRRVAEICEAAELGYFAAGRWTPHVTVARRVPAPDLPAVLEVLAGVSAVDQVATVTQCRRWDSDARRTWLL
jgi:2'-5' RNA ligase